MTPQQEIDIIGAIEKAIEKYADRHPDEIGHVSHALALTAFNEIKAILKQ